MIALIRDLRCDCCGVCAGLGDVAIKALRVEAAHLGWAVHVQLRGPKSRRPEWARGRSDVDLCPDCAGIEGVR